MKIATPLTLTSIALLSSVSVASAASMSKRAPTTTAAASASSMSQTKDMLSLRSSDRKTAWKDISGQAVKETAPVSFTAKVGTALPSSLTTHPVPVSTANKVPKLRPYQYALLNNDKLLIVNPSDRKIAEIISQ